jgi:CheY-like chemotaxis protein
MKEKSIKYSNISVLVIENDSMARKLIKLHLENLGCKVFEAEFTNYFSIQELQGYKMVLISVTQDKEGIRLLKNIQKKMLESNVKRKAKYVAYTECDKAIAGECMNYGFDAVLEATASLEDYKNLLSALFDEGRNL